MTTQDRPSPFRGTLPALLAGCLLTLAAACGGGSSSSAPATTTTTLPPLPTAVTTLPVGAWQGSATRTGAAKPFNVVGLVLASGQTTLATTDYKTFLMTVPLQNGQGQATGYVLSAGVTQSVAGMGLYTAGAPATLFVAGGTSTYAMTGAFTRTTASF